MGKIELPDGSFRRILSAAEVAKVMASFDAIDPFDDASAFWEVKAQGATGVLGPKRYAVLGEDGEVVVHTEHVLGGFVPPPGHDATLDNGRHVWAAEAARAHVGRLQTDELLARLSYEDDYPDWPALVRHSLSSPDAAAQLPEATGRRPFSRVVEAVATGNDAHPIGLDPGGNLSDWEEVVRFDASTGKEQRFSTDPAEVGTTTVDSLRARGVDWGHKTERTAPERVVVDPLLLRHVGKSGGVFVDESPQHLYRDVDEAAVLMEAAGALGTRRFAELTGLPERTARAMVSGRRPAPATVRRAMGQLTSRLTGDPLSRLRDLAEQARGIQCRWPGCEAPPARPGASWCPTHRRRSGDDRRRRKERTT